MKPVIGVRIIIRELVLEDRDAYADWQCSSEVGEFLSWLPVSAQESFQNLQKAIEQQGMEIRCQYFLAIVRKKDEEVVGSVGLELREKNSSSMGWFIRKLYWSRGYASEAVALLIDYGFRAIGLDEIQASCRKENTRSEGIMKKCGFLLSDETEKRLYYSLTKEEWNQGG